VLYEKDVDYEMWFQLCEKIGSKEEGKICSESDEDSILILADPKLELLEEYTFLHEKYMNLILSI